MKELLFLILLGTFLTLLGEPQQQRIYPFVPPLVHTHQMSLSPIGISKPPPYLLLEDIQAVTQKSCEKCDDLQQRLERELVNGQNRRVDMQQKAKQLSEYLPPTFLEQARHNRNKNSQAIGEVKVWEKLSQQN